MEGADRADPLIVARNHLWRDGEPHEVVVIGLVPLGVVSPPLARGFSPRNNGEIAADESSDLKVGQRARIGTTIFTVSGLTRSTTVLAGLPLVFMTLPDAQALVFRGQSVASAVVTTGRPNSVPEGFAIRSPEDVVEDTARPLEQAVKSINLVRFLLWIVATMIIAGVVYLSALERRRDFAVLKAVGADTRGLLIGLGLQSVFIALASAVLATGLQAIAAPLFPLKVVVLLSALLSLPLVATGVALVASIGGMRQVARTDPALVFSV